MVFSGYMPSSGIGGSYGRFITSLLRNLHTVFHSGCTNLHFQQHSSAVPISPHPVHFYCFFNFTILYWFCHISTWIRHRYTHIPHPEPSSLLPPRTIPLSLLAICMSSLGKCLPRSSAHFLIRPFVQYWAIWAAYIFWRLILCQLLHLLLFSSILRDVF